MTPSPGGELVVVGAGGFGRETVQAVHAMNSAGARWDLLGYLDDDPSLTGRLVDGTPVLGGLHELELLPNASVVVCTGRPGNYASRPRLVEALGLPSERFATITHPSAVISTSSIVGSGSVLLACTVLTAAAWVGSHVAVMPHVTITHDDIIEDFATLGSGTRLGGGVRICLSAYVGAGALIRENRTVGAYALVGMGAVATTDVPPREVWAGVPARFLRVADAAGALSGHTP
jgi:sugar O-acyltransferase (sialic acid O-acetyltransferase NeuD family)